MKMLLTEKGKPFDFSLASTMSCLANAEVSMKFNNSVLVQQNYSSLYSNFILNLCLVYQLNNSSCNNFTLKFFYFFFICQINKKQNQNQIYLQW